MDEKGSQKALEIRRKYIEGFVEIVTPELIMFEVLNALRYKGLFTCEELKRIAEALDAYGFDLHVLRGGYAVHTVDLACMNDLTVYDASYISLAELEETQMYTFDSKLIDKLHSSHRQHIKDVSITGF